MPVFFVQRQQENVAPRHNPCAVGAIMMPRPSASYLVTNSVDFHLFAVRWQQCFFLGLLYHVKKRSGMAGESTNFQIRLFRHINWGKIREHCK